MSGPVAEGGRTGAGVGLGIDDVVVRYGDVVALDHLSLDVAGGEVVAVLGASGSGKSTLLRAVAGLEPLAAGSIHLGDRDLAGIPTHRRGLGLMFQDHALFTHLDVAANIGYGLKVASVPSATRRARVGELLELVGLTSLAARRVDELSGGEAQRVALARALAPAPGLLMLDEPLGSLDRALREQLTGELRRLLSSLGQTALHVTHDQGEAFALADRVAVLDGGRLLAVDHPDRLWSNPRRRPVAEFLGQPNLWSVTVDGDGRVRLDGVDLGLLAGEHPLRAVGPGRYNVMLAANRVELVGRDQLESDRAGPDSVDAGGRVVFDAVVTEASFDRGRYRIKARVLGAVDLEPDRTTSRSEFAHGDLAGDRAFMVETDVARSMVAGEPITFQFDVDELQMLID